MAQFTREELLEIEKMADYMASMHAHSTAKLLETFAAARIPPENELVQKIMTESISAWNTYREISAKAHRMQIGD